MGNEVKPCPHCNAIMGITSGGIVVHPHSVTCLLSSVDFDLNWWNDRVAEMSTRVSDSQGEGKLKFDPQYYWAVIGTQNDVPTLRSELTDAITEASQDIAFLSRALSSLRERMKEIEDENNLAFLYNKMCGIMEKENGISAYAFFTMMLEYFYFDSSRAEKEGEG